MKPHRPFASRSALVLAAALAFAPLACTSSKPAPHQAPEAPDPAGSAAATAPVALEAAARAASGAPSVAPPLVASVAPSVEPEPRYVLADDLDARRKAITDGLGPRTRFEVVEETFLIAAPSGALGSSAAVAKMALHAYFNGRFSKKPGRAVSVLLFDAAPPYDAYCLAQWSHACSTPFGFYDRRTRTVVLNAAPGLGTLTHELVHPIVESDFPQAPEWLNEGIASYFEAYGFPRPGEIRGTRNFRLPGLLAALRARPEETRPSLPALFAMRNEIFRGEEESLNYATARYFCYWLDTQDKLWPFYRAWRDGFESDPTGERALVATMGKTPAELDAAWGAWVRAL